MTNQARFIEMIIDGRLVVSKKKKQILVNELHVKGFKAIPRVIDARKQGEFEAVTENDDEIMEEEEDRNAAGAGHYDYLLGVGSLTRNFRYVLTLIDGYLVLDPRTI